MGCEGRVPWGVRVGSHVGCDGGVPRGASRRWEGGVLRVVQAWGPTTVLGWDPAVAMEGSLGEGRQ